MLRAIRAMLPRENLLYLGDTARVPYGNKSEDTVIRYSWEDAGFLVSRGVKMIVIACNTASALGADSLRTAWPDLPILGVIGPGARAALAATQNRRIGVIATAATIESRAYELRLRQAFAESGTGPDPEITGQACPLFVPLVEEGETESEITRLIAEKYLAGLRASGIDTLVLGCTHYPLLRPMLGEVMGPGVTLVDSAEAAAAETAALLADRDLLNESTADGTETYFVTDAAARFQRTAERFLGHAPESLSLVELEPAG